MATFGGETALLLGSITRSCRAFCSASSGDAHAMLDVSCKQREACIQAREKIAHFGYCSPAGFAHSSAGMWLPPLLSWLPEQQWHCSMHTTNSMLQLWKKLCRIGESKNSPGYTGMYVTDLLWTAVLGRLTGFTDAAVFSAPCPAAAAAITAVLLTAVLRRAAAAARGAEAVAAGADKEAAQ